MSLVSVAIYVDDARQQRGRICLREDGFFCFALECRSEETEELEAYWRPTSVSGIYGTADQALFDLMQKIPDAIEIHSARPAMKQPSGFWPEP
jgi:hypothetical protein